MWATNYNTVMQDRDKCTFALSGVFILRLPYYSQCMQVCGIVGSDGGFPGRTPTDVVHKATTVSTPLFLVPSLSLT